jgi:hypothetical protein
MRLVLAVLFLLVAGLLAQAILDSAIGAWVAFVAVFAILVMRLFGLTGEWPDGLGGDD